MRISLATVLYLASATMLAGSAWIVYQHRALWNQQTATDATKKGRDDAVTLTAAGRGSVRSTGKWNYGNEGWWQQFKQPNLIGFVPKPDDGGNGSGGDPTVTTPVATPLEEIFELVVCFRQAKGHGNVPSHVVIRYKQEAQVKPPQWWLDENTAVAHTASRSNLMAYPSDRVAARKGAQQPMANPSLAGREILQHLWVEPDAGDERHGNRLWGQYRHIRLVRVDPSGESAWFVRDVPPKDGEPATEPKEEQILKTSAGISQRVRRALLELQGRSGTPAARLASAEPTRGWLEVEQTTRIGNEFHIGTQDERLFADPGDLLAAVHFDTFASRFSDTRGLIVRNIKPELAQKFGIQTDDLLLSINNRAVASPAQAANMAKNDYKRGVRTFTTRWWSNGQEIERVYRAR